MHSTSSVTYIHLYARSISSLPYTSCFEEGWERTGSGSVKRNLSRGAASANPIDSTISKVHEVHCTQGAGSVLAKARLPPSPLGSILLLSAS